MDSNKAQDHLPALTHLRQEWAVFIAVCLAFLASTAGLLWRDWQGQYALRWLVLAAPLVIFTLGVLWHGLEKNHRPNETALLITLGWGNWLSALRGLLVAGMMGFFFLPMPPGWLVWLPAIFYLLSDVTDFLDGYLARITNHTTRLGETLDMRFDGLGVLAAVFLAVQYGKVPAWYLLVGLARYLFLAGLWLRRRQNKPSYELPAGGSGIARRVLAAFQMGFLAVVLLPPIAAPGTQTVSYFFGIPFLIGFTRDWLFASGVLRPRPQNSLPVPPSLLRWLALGIRLGSALLGILSLLPAYRNFAGLPPAQALLVLLQSLALILLALGVLNRSVAVSGLVLLGLQQIFSGLSPLQILLAAGLSASVFLGPGSFALWSPEERLVYHHAGEIIIPN